MARERRPPARWAASVSAGLLLVGCGEPTGPDEGQAGPTTPIEVSAVRLEPTVTRAGEPFRLSIRVSGTGASLLHAHPLESLGLRLAGVAVDSLVLRDDGTQGDEAAGDGWFTAGGLILPAGAHGVAAVTLTGFSALHEPGAPHTDGVAGLRVSFRTGDPTVLGSPPVTNLAEGMRATTRVVGISDAGARGLDEPDVEAFGTRYYEVFPDDRDFLVVSIPPTVGADWSARAYELFNDVGGIGLPLDRWRHLGSPDRLSVLVHARQEVYTVHEDGAGSFCLLTHELAHRWVAYVGEPLADATGHWIAGTLDRSTSALGDSVGCVFNDLELYLAGLLPADSVSNPLTAAGYTVGQLEELRGPRAPAFGEAPSTFTIGYVVVSEAPLSDFEIAWFDHMAAEYTARTSALGTNWAEAVGGRASLDPEVALPARAR